MVAFDAATPPNVSAASAAASATTGGTPPVGGLDGRPANATCLAGDPPSTTVSLAVQRVFPNLPNFTQPIAMLQEPGNSARWYVVQKTGSVRVFDNTPNVSTTSEFINLASRLNSESGQRQRRTRPARHGVPSELPHRPARLSSSTRARTPALGLVDRVSQFRSPAGGTTLDPASELELFNVDDPESNHNGGNIAFGPDGFLYIGIGDGGGGGDAHGTIGNGQLLTTLLGKMLRIDVVGVELARPPTPSRRRIRTPANARCNVNGTGAANCPEIFAYGFRNPWRWSFDRGSGQLWLNDVGQSALEEVDLVTLGGNYGWRCFEGTSPFNATCGPNPSPIAPIAQYGRSLGQSTTGGVVYRGSAIPTCTAAMCSATSPPAISGTSRATPRRR